MESELDLGIITPVLSLRPGNHAPWERDAGIEEVAVIAAAADRLGYDFLSCCEHVAVPAGPIEIGGVRSGATYWDPLATFGYLTAHTSRIHFATMVLVIPHHHPLEVAKRYGTLDRICGGRLVLGIGVGYSIPEFELLGTPFDDRGARSDDAIHALKASFGRVEPVYDGTHFRYRDFIVAPSGLQQDVPIWIGGMSRRSLRRAVELGDAWAPFALTREQISGWLAAARETEAWERRSAPLRVALSPDAPLDPTGKRADAVAAARSLRDTGATTLTLRFVHDSVEHYLEQLEAMTEVVGDV